MYDETISVEEIVSYFKENDDLLGKPKLFFIQACRADVEDDNTGIDYEKPLCPPDSSDILVAYSTIDGELSYRNIRNGSWFIQTLLKQISTHAYNEHLMNIMIMVNKEIAESELSGYRQMPQQVSTLTKFVYFKMAEVGKMLEAKNSIFSSDGTPTRIGPNSLADYNNEHGESAVTRPRSLYDYNHDSESRPYRGDTGAITSLLLNRYHDNEPGVFHHAVWTRPVTPPGSTPKAYFI